MEEETDQATRCFRHIFDNNNLDILIQNALEMAAIYAPIRI